MGVSGFIIRGVIWSVDHSLFPPSQTATSGTLFSTSRAKPLVRTGAEHIGGRDGLGVYRLLSPMLPRPRNGPPILQLK